MFKELKGKTNLLPEPEKNKFYHKAINANLNSNHPDMALDILKCFEKSEITMPYYKLILYDRYSVAYLALGEVENAKNNIEKAISMAEKANNIEWMGIVYSDYAYLQYRGYQNQEQTCKYFMKAYNIQFSKLTYCNRIGELLQQKSFAELLQGDLENALTDVNMSIEVCEKIHCTYLVAKSINLKGIIQVLLNCQQEGVITWSTELIFVKK